MSKNFLLSIITVFSFISITSPKINARINVEQNVKLTPVSFVYGDPCSSYGFRLRHPEQCYINDYVEYDTSVSLFPFFGRGHFGHGHHHGLGHGGSGIHHGDIHRGGGNHHRGSHGRHK